MFITLSISWFLLTAFAFISVYLYNTLSYSNIMKKKLFGNLTKMTNFLSTTALPKIHHLNIDLSLVFLSKQWWIGFTHFQHQVFLSCENNLVSRVANKITILAFAQIFVANKCVLVLGHIFRNFMIFCW